MAEIGPVPSEDDDNVSDELWQELEKLATSIEFPVTSDEARILCTLFGPDDGYGINWTLLHLVESCPNWPLDDCLVGDMEWISRLRRAQNP